MGRGIVYGSARSVTAAKRRRDHAREEVLRLVRLQSTGRGGCEAVEDAGKVMLEAEQVYADTLAARP